METNKSLGLERNVVQKWHKVCPDWWGHINAILEGTEPTSFFPVVVKWLTEVFKKSIFVYRISEYPALLVCKYWPFIWLADWIMLYALLCLVLLCVYVVRLPGQGPGCLGLRCTVIWLPTALFPCFSLTLGNWIECDFSRTKNNE